MIVQRFACTKGAPVLVDCKMVRSLLSDLISFDSREVREDWSCRNESRPSLPTPLDVGSNSIETEGLQARARTGYFPHLKSLTLSGSGIGAPEMAALAASPFFPHLKI